MCQDLRHPNIQLLDGAVLINGKKHSLPITKEYILKECNDVFSGIGTLTGDEYCSKLKKDYEPVQHPTRSVPGYKEELQQLCSEGTITTVWGNAKCTNSKVSVRKANGILGISLDPKDLSKSIERDQYYTRTIDDHSAESMSSSISL